MKSPKHSQQYQLVMRNINFTKSGAATNLVVLILCLMPEPWWRGAIISKVKDVPIPEGEVKQKSS
ncbi:hypothetical protein Ahy_A07g034890 isoform B [Arachis hypogaea]|uniref:Uncharacterized protein n=1 Tax=Arachis hypogaea TaxID=3818 RepID=A0A445CD94_ARAHY|nr:hypothetical protein Ahy_A07g034890 isoform B [Arachis hypogaea]